ncbi:MAG: hypothetical protein NT166_06115 [Candidatus Aminicenantes bacterium]|nr:hypothetical protein [Candidatus Aminicenantes bacterium]
MVTQKQYSSKRNKKVQPPRVIPSSEYDAAWKDMIEMHFEAFVEFFYPDIHKDINFSRPPEILSNELRKILPHSKLGNRRADALIKVYLKNGLERYIWVYIHIEVQGKKDTDFPERLFVYYYRIFEKFRESGTGIISLAVLTDEDENYRPDEYYSKLWGFELRMHIPLIKIIDYKNKKELQEKVDRSANPMAMVVKAQLKSFEAKKGDNDKKYTIKWELIRQLYSQGYDSKYIRSLFDFIDLIFHLPEYLEKKLSEKINNLEEEKKMPHILSWERIAKKEGKMVGKKEGKQKEKRDTALRMLSDGLPVEAVSKYTGLSGQQVKALVQ